MIAQHGAKRSAGLAVHEGSRAGLSRRHMVELAFRPAARVYEVKPPPDPDPPQQLIPHFVRDDNPLRRSQHPL